MWPFIVIGVLLILMVIISPRRVRPNRHKDMSGNDHSDDFKELNRGLPNVKNHYRIK